MWLPQHPLVEFSKIRDESYRSIFLRNDESWYKYKHETLPFSVTLVERPVRAFAPRKGHPPMDASQSGAGTWQLATPGKLGSTSSPAAPSSHQGLLLNDQLLSFYCYLLLFLKPPRPMPPAQKEGEDGALPGLLPSSPPEHLQGLGPWPRTKQGGRMELNVFTDKEFHPPSAHPQASSAFSSGPTNRQSWERSQAASSPQIGLVEM